MSSGAGGGREPHNPGKLGEAIVVAFVCIVILLAIFGLIGWLKGDL